MMHLLPAVIAIREKARHQDKKEKTSHLIGFIFAAEKGHANAGECCSAYLGEGRFASR
jgi:hypothetical protein